VKYKLAYGYLNDTSNVRVLSGSADVLVAVGDYIQLKVESSVIGSSLSELDDFSTANISFLLIR
jgi:hypothetical protein